MKFFSISKDGGPESNVTGFWLVEIKSFFSIALLRFSHGTRESFHSHAFNCISWLLSGELEEQTLRAGDVPNYDVQFHNPSLVPIITRRSTFHRVKSWGTSWVLTFRGPWAKEWKEFDPSKSLESILTHGRVVVRRQS